MSKKLNVYCVARGRDSEWEAFCLDFDLAVQGRSYDEVVARLKTAIVDYVHSAAAEPEPVRNKLLTRCAPWATTLSWKWRVAFWAFCHRNEAEESTFGFPVPYPA